VKVQLNFYPDNFGATLLGGGSFSLFKKVTASSAAGLEGASCSLAETHLLLQVFLEHGFFQLTYLALH